MSSSHRCSCTHTHTRFGHSVPMAVLLTQRYIVIERVKCVSVNHFADHSFVTQLTAVDRVRNLVCSLNDESLRERKNIIIWLRSVDVMSHSCEIANNNEIEIVIYAENGNRTTQPYDS